MAKFSMLQTASVLLSFEYVSGHGWTEWPPARQFCTKTPIPGFKDTKGCRQVGPIQYEPQSTGNGSVAGNPKQVVQTKICGAGIFSGPDHAPASDWKATEITPDAKGGFTFKYHCTACHTTSTWEVYQTTSGWTGQQPLRWSDLKPFCKLDAHGKKPAKDASFACPFPEATRNPRDMIVVLWDRVRGDSGEMFFSCSDVIIKGGRAPGTGPNPTKPETAPTPTNPVPATTTPAPGPNPVPATTTQAPEPRPEEPSNGGDCSEWCGADGDNYYLCHKILGQQSIDQCRNSWYWKENCKATCCELCKKSSRR